MGYTKLGHINLPKSELTDLLGDGSNYYNYPKIKNTLDLTLAVFGGSPDFNRTNLYLYMTYAIIVDINLLSLYTIYFYFMMYDYLLDEFLNYLIHQFIYLSVFLN